MTKIKNLFKNISIFLCLVPMLLLSLFCLVPSRQVLDVSAAEQVVTDFSFVGGNLIMPMTSFSTGGSYDVTSLCNNTFSFTITNGQIRFFVNGQFLRKDLTSTRVYSAELFALGYNSSDGVQHVEFTSGYVVDFAVSRSDSIISNNIDRVVITSGIASYNNSVRWTCITYYDVNNNFVSFYSLWLRANSSIIYDDFVMSNRTYYLVLGQLSENQYYQAGYTNGYNDGVSDGETIGYNEGYGVGHSVGYGNGYSAGVEHGGDYTFTSLFGAVLDAPVSAFTSLLNFDLLGFNLLSFVTGLLTLAIIIFIIKLCLGGK